MKKEVKYAALAVAIMLTGSLLVSAPANASISFVVNSWDRNLSSGLVDYSISVSGHNMSSTDACGNDYCEGSVEFGYQNDNLEWRVAGKRAFFVYAKNTPNYSYTLTETKQKLANYTHVRAYLKKYGSGYEPFAITEWQSVAAPPPAATINMQVDSWERNLTTGKVDYQITVSAQNIASTSSGCFGYGYCEGWVEFGYQDDNLEWRVVGEKAFLVSASNTWAYTREMVGNQKNLANYTHVRAYLKKYGSGYEPFAHTAWQSVAAPPPPASLTMTINSWERISEIDRVNYTLTLLAKNIASTSSGCFGNGYCEGWVEFGYQDSYGEWQTRRERAFQLSSINTWEYTRTMIGNEERLNGYTHVRTYLKKYGSGYEPFAVSAWRFMPELMTDGIDVDSLLEFMPEGAEAAFLADQSKVCERLLVPKYAYSGDRDSLPDMYERCMMASNLKIAIKVVLALGGTAAVCEMTDCLGQEDFSGDPLPPDYNPPDLDNDPTTFPIGNPAPDDQGIWIRTKEVSTYEVYIPQNSPLTRDDIESSIGTFIRTCRLTQPWIPGKNDLCEGDVPIYFVGGDVHEARDFRLDTVQNPSWMHVVYNGRIDPNEKTVRRDWYEGIPPCSMYDGTTHDCDEFPNFATEKGYNGVPVPIRPVPQSDNRKEGALLNAFWRACGVESAPLGQGPTEESQYLTVPIKIRLPSGDEVPTFGICSVKQ